MLKWSEKRLDCSFSWLCIQVLLKSTPWRYFLANHGSFQSERVIYRLFYKSAQPRRWWKANTNVEIAAEPTTADTAKGQKHDKATMFMNPSRTPRLFEGQGWTEGRGSRFTTLGSSCLIPKSLTKPSFKLNRVIFFFFCTVPNHNKSCLKVLFIKSSSRPFPVNNSST